MVQLQHTLAEPRRENKLLPEGNIPGEHVTKAVDEGDGLDALHLLNALAEADLLVDVEEGSVGAVLLADALVLVLVVHGPELLLSVVRLRVQHLTTTQVVESSLQITVDSVGIKGQLVRLTVDSNVEHKLALLAPRHPELFVCPVTGDADRQQPEGVDAEVFLDVRDELVSVLRAGEDAILHDVVARKEVVTELVQHAVELAGGAEPCILHTDNNVVWDTEDVKTGLGHPESSTIVTEQVVLHRNRLFEALSGHFAGSKRRLICVHGRGLVLNMPVVPLIPTVGAKGKDRKARCKSVGANTSDDHARFGTNNKAIHVVRRVGGVGERLHGLKSMKRVLKVVVLNMHVRSGGLDAENNLDKNGKSAIGGGHGVEKIGIFSAGAGKLTAITKNNIDRVNSVVEMAIRVAGALNTTTVDSTTDSDAGELGNHKRHHTKRKSDLSQLVHRHTWLNSHKFFSCSQPQ
eukprot:Colp12_sorted_trinity150504_noHs@30184